MKTPVGMKKGTLTVIANLMQSDEQPLVSFIPGHPRPVVLCKCDCTNLVLMLQESFLKREMAKHCIRCKAIKHGQSIVNGTGKLYDPTYKTWRAMRDRVSRSEKTDKPIYLDPRWNDFETFLKDMGQRPLREMSIDRIDNSKGYTPDNCRWATWKQQNRNRTNTHKITHQGETKSCNDWVESLGLKISGQTLWNRISSGWPLEKAFTLLPRARVGRKTHCKNGHEFTPENIEYSTTNRGTSYRRCKTCRLERAAAYNERRREERKLGAELSQPQVSQDFRPGADHPQPVSD